MSHLKADRHAIRHATKSDAPELARLFALLGHPASTDDILLRWTQWEAAGNIVLVVPKQDGTLAAAATLSQMVVLHRPKPVGRISALVVDQDMRGKGIGRALVAAAEEVLADAGCGLLEITSHQRLAAAHDFYAHLGYKRTSIRLARDLKSRS